MRELHHERLSTAAAKTGETSRSVLELVTFYNAYYEDRYRSDSKYDKGKLRTAEDENEAGGSYEAVTEAMVLGDVIIGVPVEEDAPNKAAGGTAQKKAKDDTTSLASVAALACASFGPVTQALSPLTRLRQAVALGHRVKTKVLTAAQHICRPHDRVDTSKDCVTKTGHEFHDDETLLNLLRLAVDVEEARSHAVASRELRSADDRQLLAVRTKLRKFHVDGNASAIARRFHQELTAIAFTGQDEPDAGVDVAQTWV